MLFNVVIVYLPRGVQTLGRVFRWFVGVSRFFSYIYKAIILFLGGKKGIQNPLNSYIWQEINTLAL